MIHLRLFQGNFLELKRGEMFLKNQLARASTLKHDTVVVILTQQRLT